MRALLRRLRYLLQREQFDRDLEEELRFHEEMSARALADGDGLSDDEARAAARRRIGSHVRWREAARDPWTFRAGETLAQDIRHAVRLLLRAPAFSIAALATLALGIGLNTAIFSVAYGVLWRPLPYADPARLVVLGTTQLTPSGPRAFWTWTPAAVDALREHATTLEALSAYASQDAHLTGRGEPRQIAALRVSRDFFETLGVAPVQGRAFLRVPSADDERTVIVSDRLWRTALSADPAIVGQTIVLDGEPRTIVGVMPADFTFRPPLIGGVLDDADVYLPGRWLASDQAESVFLLGRVKPGASHARVEAEVQPLANDPAVAPDGVREMTGAKLAGVPTTVRVIGLQEAGTTSVRAMLLVLLGAVAFVLLIACVNVANLQVVRLTGRRGELSVRMALGAGRGRIVRQLLTEAVVLSLIGATLGALLAKLAIHLTLPLVPLAALPRLGSIAVDARVMLFSLALSLVATLLIGLVPVLRIGGVAFGEADALHASETRTTSDRHGDRLRTLLVAGQIAMTLVLLIGAGLLLHSFLRLTSVSPGFATEGRDGVVQTVKVVLPPNPYDSPERMHAFERSVLERMRYLPGVSSASVVNSAPFGRMFIRDTFEIEGQAPPTLSAGRPKIDADYFRTMGIPLLAGREFTPADTGDAPPVAIVSERLAREYLGGPGSAIGRRVRFDEQDRWRTIIGVVADVRQTGLDHDLQPMLYVPYQQEREELYLRFVVFAARTTNPGATAEGIRAEIRRVAPDLPIQSVATMDEAVTASVAGPRFRTLLLVLFASSATLIAVCGIYGLMAYAVSQRRREIGVRMALGAGHRDVVNLVLGRALRIIVVGVAMGLAGSVIATRVLRRFLFDVTPTDPIVFVLVSLLLMSVGLVAAWLPARRASRIDPSLALRAE